MGKLDGIRDRPNRTFRRAVRFGRGIPLGHSNLNARRVQAKGRIVSWRDFDSECIELDRMISRARSSGDEAQVLYLDQFVGIVGNAVTSDQFLPPLKASSFPPDVLLSDPRIARAIETARNDLTVRLDEKLQRLGDAAICIAPRILPTPLPVAGIVVD